MRRPSLVIALALAAAATVALALPRPATADGPTAAPARPFATISVTGTTELAIAPDEAWVHIGVETFRPSIDLAVADNDKRIAGVLAALRSAGIAPADMSTTMMSLAETDRYESGDRRVHGFQVSRSLVARVRDLARLEALLQQILKSGATHLREIVFSHSQLAQKKAEARTAAMKAARDKAELMAKAVGQGVGRAVKVTEGGPGFQTQASNTYANEVLNMGGQTLDGQTIAAGRIRVEIGVAVDFELL